jgi:hypothetical protein
MIREVFGHELYMGSSLTETEEGERGAEHVYRSVFFKASFS